MSIPASQRGFPETLKRLRERRLLSQTALADCAGLEHSYLSRLEGGHREPSRDTVERLADALGLDRYDTDVLHITAGYLPPGVWLVDAPHILQRSQEVPRD